MLFRSMRVFLTSKIKELGNAGEMFEVKAIEGKKLLLSNGQYVNPRQFKDRLDVGEMRELAIAKGDVVRLTVNLKMPDFKINNGSLAVATGNPNEFILLDHNRKVLRSVRLPENFRGLKYGWVITSHSSQGMTSKNVVVAAEKMSGQAFYVACSRGRKDLSLHVPEKEFFKDRLVKIPTERKLVMDISGGVIPTIPHWKAPVLPPPPDELIGSRLRPFMDRVHEQMRKAQEVIAGYIQRAMYHVFNHNIRKKDHERKEQIRKQFREKCAAIIKLADAERDRLAEERKKAEAERVAAEQATAEQAKTVSVHPQPEPPRVPDGWIPSRWNKSENNDSERGKTRSDADKSGAGQSISTGTSDESRSRPPDFADLRAITDKLAEQTYRKLAQENAEQSGNSSGTDAERTTAEQSKPVTVEPQPEVPRVPDGWLPSQWKKSANNGSDTGKTRSDADKSGAGQSISTGTSDESRSRPPDFADLRALTDKLAEQTYRKLAQKNVEQSGNIPVADAERTTAEESKPVTVEPQPIVPEPVKPEHEEQKYEQSEHEQSRNEHEQPKPEPAGNGTEQSRNEKDDRHAKLVALAEKRKRESPGGIDI